MNSAAYVLSAGHSGSTLLNMLLGSHSNALPVSELTQLPRNIDLNTICTCGEPVTTCPFWHPTLSQLAEKLELDVWRNPYSLQLGYIGAAMGIPTRHLTRTYRLAWKARHSLVYLFWKNGFSCPTFFRKTFQQSIDNTFALYDIIRTISGKSLIVDASKGYLKGIALYKRQPQTTRLIYLSRDGRASFYSRLRRGFGRRNSLAAWRNYYERSLPLIETHVASKHVLKMHYEDLVRSPDEVLTRACAFLGLKYEAGMLAYSELEHHIVNGNNMRLRKRSGITLDTAWQSKLSASDLSYFEKHAGPVNRRLGYD